MSDSENHDALAAESPEAGRSSTAAHTKGPELSYDPLTGVVTIDGYRFTRELFQHITASPLGITLRITKRQDGVVHMTQDFDPVAADMLAALQLVSRFFVDPDDTISDHYLEVLEVVRAAIAKATGTAQ